MQLGKVAVSAGVSLVLPSPFRDSCQLAGAADTHHAFLASPEVNGQVGVIQGVTVDAVRFDILRPRGKGCRELGHDWIPPKLVLESSC